MRLLRRPSLIGRILRLPRRIVSAWWRFKRRLSGTPDRLIADRAVKEIAAEIHEAEMLVLEARVTLDGYVRVRCIPETLEQAEAYRAICARAYRTFHELPIEKLFAELSPLEPLDIIWAQVHQIPECGMLAWTSPCVSCGETSPIKWVFGRAALREQRDMSRERVRAYAAHDGERILLKGHLCPDCLKKSRFILLPGRADDLEDA